MKPDKPSVEQIRELFSQARELPTGERAAFLKKACGGDPGLLKEVESLLRVYDSADGLLQHDASGANLSGTSNLAGTTVNGYRLIERIGEGGFGEVYRAEQTEPLHREVALKIIKLGMDTKNVIARFEAERQALARMNHPGIAQVFDAGATKAGRPYFVMELVKGVPFIDYCNQNRLPLPARLNLFREVCEAVQHAHQKGILHRDLKPSNILVSEENGDPQPKIIDFGVAKSLEGRLTEQTLATLQEMLIGTPLYMSPEQLNPDIDDIDTRSDIYSLGIILYELVAGTTPLEGELTSPLTIAEMRRILNEKDLPRPSRRLHTLGPKTTTIASERQIKPPTLERLLRGDLDWVVMKAIERERERRYGDVATLADDLQRYLNHEPVSAGPPGLTYRSRKFIRRHRTSTAVAASLAASLLLGVVVSSIGFLRARQETKRAEKEAYIATKQFEIAEAAFSFIEDELLLKADPWRQPEDRNITLKEIVDQSAGSLKQYFDGQPEALIRIHQIYSSLYIRLGEYDKALEHAEHSMMLAKDIYKSEQPERLDASRQLAFALSHARRDREARFMFRKLLEIQKKVLGMEHPATLDTMHQLAFLINLKEAEVKLRYVVDVRTKTLGIEHDDTLNAMDSLAIILTNKDQFQEAEEILRKTASLRSETKGARHPETLDSLQALGTCLYNSRNFAEAESILSNVLATRKTVLGDEHPITLKSAHNLALTRLELGQENEAEAELRRILEIQQRIYGPDHPDTLLTTYNIAFAISRQGDRFVEAESILRELSAKQERIYGEDSSKTIDTKWVLAKELSRHGKHGDSADIYRDILKIRKLELREDHPAIAKTLNRLATELRKAGKNEEAAQVDLEIQQFNINSM